MNEEMTPHDQGQQSAENGGTWRDNPHQPGSREWYEFEDGRRDGGATDVGPTAGCPSWA